MKFRWVLFSCSVMSNSLRHHELQSARHPFPSSTPTIIPNLCPSSRCYGSTILSSVVPFSSCQQYFPGAGSFPMSQLFALGGQNIGASASISVLPINMRGWSPLEWTGWISLQPKESQESSTPQSKSINSLAFIFLCIPTVTSILDHWKNHSLDKMDLCWQSNLSAFKHAV